MALMFDDDMPADILAYHQRTKHSSVRYALGPAMLDWENQPYPFRLFEGARQIPLPLTPTPAEPEIDGQLPAQPITPSSIGLFLELALGLSAWKEAGGARWALRNNPSSGNLHPTEGWMVLPPTPGIGDRAALYHYTPLTHALEERRIFEVAPDLPEGGFLMALSSLPWRESWKYGERAFRYCQHDIGHAIAALSYAGACLGWKARVLAEPGDAQIAGLLGLHRPDAHHRFEVEHPDLALVVGPGPEPVPLPVDLPSQWAGAANRLSPDHESWPAVDLAIRFTTKRPSPERDIPDLPAAPAYPAPAVTLPQAIKVRRSAQRMDGKTHLSRSAFLRILAQTQPDPEKAPWNAFPYPPRTHLFLFVHRVTGVAPGLYALVRDADALDRLKNDCDPAFVWERLCPELPLYLLKAEDLTKLSARLSCQQAIAGFGAFSLGMVADFERTLAEDGDWAYRRLFWETGMIGQVLYIESTAIGMDPSIPQDNPVQGTGIGCFWDDEVHDLLGFKRNVFTWQSLYHFTIGGALKDVRLATLPAYDETRSTRPSQG
jgi:nitroreductase